MAKAEKKQTEIPGTERDTIPEVENAAIAYASRMYKRRDLQTEEKQAKLAVLSEMRERGINTYAYVDGAYEYEFHREEKQVETLSVKRKAVGGAETEAEDVPLTIVEDPHPDDEAHDADDWAGDIDDE